MTDTTPRNIFDSTRLNEARSARWKKHNDRNAVMSALNDYLLSVEEVIDARRRVKGFEDGTMVYTGTADHEIVRITLNANVEYATAGCAKAHRTLNELIEAYEMTDDLLDYSDIAFMDFVTKAMDI